MIMAPPHMPSGMDDVHWTCISATETRPMHYVYTKPIQKPGHDDREYRVVRLANGLEAVLVSDCQTDESAASLEVAVGDMSDPNDMQGLAHFCEHLLFMGTEQFPRDNEYAEYLAKNGGSYNAYTESTSTNYHFQVSAGAFEGALARLSSFFHSPLFAPSCTLRELNAVDSEHKMNLQCDVNRIYQLRKYLSKPGHPWGKFDGGNKHSLTEAARKKVIRKTGTSDVNASEIYDELIDQETRRRVIEWWSREYCASRMSLVLVGSESLDELTHYVTKYFSSIPNRGQDPCPMFRESPLGEYEAGKLIFMKTIEDVREVSIDFPIPYLAEDWRAKSAKFIAHFIEHEGPGSLHGYLKSKGWLISLCAEEQDIARGFSMFNIHAQLTKNGFKHYEEVILVCFKYLDLLRSSAFPIWIYNEQKDLADMRYHFTEKRRAGAHALAIASLLTWPTPREYIISGPKLLWEWDEQLVRDCLSELTPNNAQVFVLGQDMDEINVSGPWLSEKWYGTQYLVKDLFAKLASYRNDISELHLPLPNHFIPNAFDCPKVSAQEPLQKPELIEKTDLMEVWHKRDDQYKVPKAHVFVLMHTPRANSGVRESVMTALYAKLINDCLEEYCYDARFAGFSYDIRPDHLGLQFHLTGFSDKLDILLQRLLEKSRKLIIVPGRLQIIKENIKQSWENTSYGETHGLSDSYGRYLLEDGIYLLSDKLSAIPDISVGDIQEHAEVLFSQTKYKMLINGNIRKDEAIRLALIVEQSLSDNVLRRENAVYKLSRILPQGCNYVWELPVPNPDEVNSAVTYFCHVGDQADARLRTITLLLIQILSEPAFHVLRTQEQLGYIVSCDEWQDTEFIGLRICVQSERDPKYLETRIEAFLATMKNTLESMDQATFEEYKKSLTRRWTERSKSLSEESTCFWEHIQSGYLDFERNRKSSVILETVTKADVLSLFKTRIDPSSAERSKLSVHMRASSLSENHPTTDQDKVKLSESIVYIEDPKEFKSKLRLSGPAKPVVDSADV